jgi:hypothetical protein
MHILLSLLFACAPEPVVIDGIVFEEPGPDAAPMAGATLRFLDAADGSELDLAVSDRDGWFDAELPQQTNLFVEVTRDGLRPAYFAAVVGAERVVNVEDHALYGYDEQEAAAVEAAFADCAGGGGGPGLAVGEVRSYELATVVDGQHILIENAEVAVVSASGERWPACYYDDEGTGYLPGRAVTGESGRFVVPHLPEGLHQLELSYDLGGGQVETQIYPLWVAEGPSVAPWFPAWVGLP